MWNTMIQRVIRFPYFLTICQYWWSQNEMEKQTITIISLNIPQFCLMIDKLCNFCMQHTLYYLLHNNHGILRHTWRNGNLYYQDNDPSDKYLHTVLQHCTLSNHRQIYVYHRQYSSYIDGDIYDKPKILKYILHFTFYFDCKIFCILCYNIFI